MPKYLLEELTLAFIREPRPEEVEHRIVTDFDAAKQQRVREILDRVGKVEPWYRPWVQLAALRAANGRVELLQHWVDLGNKDPRDLQLALESIAGPGWEREYVVHGVRAL